ncbi:MAG: AAA family ATPase, partial [Bacteroidia bacterium]|nr:AAA family ATPase [Bacteroidia bacterium]
DVLERDIRRLEIEREAIKRENDEVKLAQLSQEIANLSEKRAALRAQWEHEKKLIGQIRELRERIEQLKAEADRAEQNADWGLAAEIRYGRIVEAQKQIQKAQEELNQSRGRLLHEEVDAEHIAEVVSRWTGIPVARMLESEREKLLRMEDELHRRVVGQHEAIAAISDAIRRNRAGLSDPKRPIGSFIFIGSTGVGKTELAKALADYLFNDENAMVRIDMSEYQEKHSVSRLVGAPPGYVGYDEGGQLTEAIRRRPYAVILLDEIEKAHKDVFNILLQVLDDGRLTDNKGRTANFRNSIIIMTSNLGAHLIQQHLENYDEEDKDEVHARVKAELMTMLRAQLPPEFLNRLDDVVIFTPLSRSEIRAVVDIQMQRLRETLEQKGVKLHVTEDALNWLGKTGYDPQYGARPLKRLIQRKIVNELAKLILAGKVQKDQTIVVDHLDDSEDFVF